MKNYVLLKDDGNVNFSKVDGIPNFVSHPKVKASWIWGGVSMEEGSEPITYMSLLFNDDTRKEIQWADQNDLINKANTLLSNK